MLTDDKATLDACHIQKECTVQVHAKKTDVAVEPEMPPSSAPLSAAAPDSLIPPMPSYDSSLFWPSFYCSNDSLSRKQAEETDH